MAKLAGDILSHLDLESALLSIVNAALDLLGADIVGILLADEDGDVLKMRACAGHRTIQTAHLEVRAGQGVAGKVFETGRPYRADDYRSDPSISRHFFAIAEEDGTRSALGAPMMVRGKVIGTLMVWSRHPEAFSDQDTDTLIDLANLASGDRAVSELLVQIEVPTAIRNGNHVPTPTLITELGALET